MARFPRVESEIAKLAREMVAGLASNAAVFPAPPVSAAQLEAELADYVTACAVAVATRAANVQALADKGKKLRNVAGKMRSIIRYAENTVNYSGPELGLIGWEARKPQSRLSIPGQTRDLSIRREGPDWITLAWKKPADGGAPRVYKVKRRQSSESLWEDAGVALTTEITLSGQDRGKEWEYRVVAMNRAGEGDPSNTVTAVL